MSSDDVWNLELIEFVSAEQKIVIKKLLSLNVLTTLINANAFNEASIEALLHHPQNFVFGGMTREQAVETWSHLCQRLSGMSKEDVDKLATEIMGELREARQLLREMLRNVHESTAKAASMLVLSSEDGPGAIDKLIDIKVSFFWSFFLGYFLFKTAVAPRGSRGGSHRQLRRY